MSAPPVEERPRRRRHSWPFRVVASRPRLFISVVCGVMVGLLVPGIPRPITRVLLGWNAGVWLYFILVGNMIATATEAETRRRAALQDDGSFTILILTSLAALAAFGGIFEQLINVKDTHGWVRALQVILAAATVISAWAFIHVMFALHYTYEYFAAHPEMNASPSEHPRGLRFPGTDKPDYLDFLYFSFVIGVACATADVEIWSRRIRRTALVHCVLAFFFNTAVLALTINIAAGLV